MSRRYERRWDWDDPPYHYPPPGTAIEDVVQFHRMMEDTKKRWEDEHQRKRDTSKKEHPLTAKKFSVVELAIWLSAGSIFLGPILLTFLIKNLTIFKATLEATIK